MSRFCNTTTHNNHYLPYIDTLKGFAILYVVLVHSFAFIYIDTTFTVIPLFFVLSGLFHNTNESISKFFIKRIYTLLIPYIAYNLIIWLELKALQLMGVDIPYIRNPLYIFFASYDYDLNNYALWFLPTLFISEVIFMAVDRLSRLMPHKMQNIIITIASLVIGYIGYSSEENLILFFDKGMACTPFYCMGYLFAQSPLWNKPKRYDKIGYYLIVPMIVTYILTRADLDVAKGIYEQYFSLLIINIASLFMALLYICKLVKNVPIINYFGRNSLIILCTHIILVIPIYGLYTNICKEPLLYILTEISVIILLYFPTIPFCRRFLPYISGVKPQKVQ